MKIMLAVWCFMVFAAVGERLAVSGKRERERREDERAGAPFHFPFACTLHFLLAPALLFFFFSHQAQVLGASSPVASEPSLPLPLSPMR